MKKTSHHIKKQPHTKAVHIEDYTATQLNSQLDSVSPTFYLSAAEESIDP